MRATFRLSALLAAAMLAAPESIFAADTSTPSSPPQGQSSQTDGKKKRAPNERPIIFVYTSAPGPYRVPGLSTTMRQRSPFIALVTMASACSLAAV